MLTIKQLINRDKKVINVTVNSKFRILEIFNASELL
jgi:hypothetical protein